MRIASNGNVGIGTTDTATYKLNVAGDINISAGSSFRVGGNTLSTFTPSSGNLIGVFNSAQFENVSSLIQIKSSWKPTTAGTADAVPYSGISGIPTSWSDSQIPILAISKTSGLQTALDAKQPTLTSTNTFGVFNTNHFTNSGGVINMNGSFKPSTAGTADTANALASGTSISTGTITTTGNVGIGTSSTTLYRCHIKCTFDVVSTGLHLDAGDGVGSLGANKYALTIYAYNITGGSIGWRFRSLSEYGGDNTAIQIDNNGAVYFPKGSSQPSDIRIKKDIEDINDDSALNKLLLIQPKTYNYIAEERNKGFGKVYGFIAQQIREVVPEAITIIAKELIPNIYKDCLIYNKREVYHSIPLDTPIDTLVKINNDTYKIKEIYVNYFVIDKDIDIDEAFVYGYSVDDFHSLQKEYIFTLNVCATQELHRMIEAQNIIIKTHDENIKKLIAMNEDKEARLRRLENLLNISNNSSNI
jgi:hypothetical protein